MNRALKAAGWIAFGLLTATAVCTAYWLLFSTFQEHDDEGYVLISLKNYAEHGQLYHAVATQYGPAPYVFYDLLHRLFGFAFDHTASRWATLAYWLIAALASARFVQRLTNSAGFATAAFALTFAYLWPMIQEPIHPGGLIAALVAIVAVGGAELWERGRINAFAGVAGAATAVLLLTKVNVGVFFAGSVIAWFAANTRPRGVAKALTWLIAAGCALLPAVLMQRWFGEPWVRAYALLFICASVGLLLAVWHAGERNVGGKTWLRFLGAALLAGGGIVLAVMARGTSWNELWNGVVVSPLRHPSVYALPMTWAPGAVLVGLIAVAASGGCAWQNAWDRPAVIRALAFVRVALAVLMLASACQWLPWSLNVVGMSFAVPLAWTLASPLQGSSAKRSTALWIATVLVLQFLQAYPVAGTQVSWGTFLVVPLMFAAVHDALPQLNLVRPWLRLALEGSLLAGGAVAVTSLALFGHARFVSSPRFDEPGAETLRFGGPVAGAYRIFAENARHHADMLFSLPGSYSLNLWSGVPTPTLANVTHWFSVLSDVQQQEIENRLAATPRAMVFVQPEHLAYLEAHGFSTRSPLTEWIETHFENALTLDTFQLWVPRGRSLALYSTARFTATTRSAGSGEADRLVLTLAELPAPVATVEMQDLEYPRVRLPALNGANAQVAIAPCAEDDRELAPLRPERFPFRVTASSHVELRFASTVPIVRWPMIVLRLRGVDGTLLKELRVVQPPARRRD